MIVVEPRVVFQGRSIFHNYQTRWWLQAFLFSRLFGEDEPIFANVFEKGVETTN